MTNSKKSHKTISIFLNSGEPDGFRTAQLSNWVGKALIFPRNHLSLIKDEADGNKPAVYFLIGDNDNSLQPSLYIGESENLYNRISHHTNKDFWNVAIAFISKDDNITKTHAKYLESHCIELAQAAGKVKLENDAKSVLPLLSLSDQAYMEDFLIDLKILLNSLGYSFLEKPPSIKNNVDNTLFFCGNSKLKNKSTGRLLNNGFIVYKNSKVTKIRSKSSSSYLNTQINNLLLAGYLEETKDFYLFVKDFVFKTPSSASTIILGRNSNGWIDWKNNKNQTLNDIHRT